MSDATAPEGALVLAHVSDLHLDGSPTAYARAARVVEHLVEVGGGLDAVLVTGDVSDRGASDDYEAVRRLFTRVPVPTVFAPGNHDDRTAFAAALLDRRGHAEHQPINQVLDLAPSVRVVVLDSVLPRSTHGLLQETTLNWLDATLTAAPTTFTLVALHHPPIPLELPRLDLLRLSQPERLAAVMARHPQVGAVLCGHAHTAAAAEFAGRPVRVAPGVRSSAVLPCEVGPGAAGMMRTDVPVALLFHMIGRHGLVTHVRSLPDTDSRGSAG